MKMMLLSRIRKRSLNGFTRRENVLKIILVCIGFLLATLTSQPVQADSKPITPTPVPNLDGQSSPGKTTIEQDPTGDVLPHVGNWQDFFLDWFSRDQDNGSETSAQSIFSQVSIEKDPDHKFVLLAEVDALAKKWRKNLIDRSGWIHRLVRYRLSDGGIETKYTLEGWYLIDDQQNLVQAFERVTSEDGKSLEERLFKVGTWEKMGLSPVPTGWDIEMDGFDFGFAREASSTLPLGRSLSRSTLYENCWYMGETYTLSDGGKRLSALYFPDTGKLRRLEAWQINSEGIVSDWSLNLSVEEQIDKPPEDFLTYFND